MSTNQQQAKKAAVSSGPSAADKYEKWDEDKLEQALKHLNSLHVKCRQLRTTIPRMLQPLPNDLSSEELYRHFVNSLTSGGEEIKNFATLYNSEETRKVMQQVKKSRDANPKGIKPWRARDFPEWMDTAP